MIHACCICRSQLGNRIFLVRRVISLCLHVCFLLVVIPLCSDGRAIRCLGQTYQSGYHRALLYSSRTSNNWRAYLEIERQRLWTTKTLSEGQRRVMFLVLNCFHGRLEQEVLSLLLQFVDHASSRDMGTSMLSSWAPNRTPARPMALWAPASWKVWPLWQRHLLTSVDKWMTLNRYSQTIGESKP